MEDQNWASWDNTEDLSVSKTVAIEFNKLKSPRTVAFNPIQRKTSNSVVI